MLVQASVAYYLMSDNRRRMPSSAYLRAEMTESNDVTSSRHSGEQPLDVCSAQNILPEEHLVAEHARGSRIK